MLKKITIPLIVFLNCSGSGSMELFQDQDNHHYHQKIEKQSQLDSLQNLVNSYRFF